MPRTPLLDLGIIYQQNYDVIGAQNVFSSRPRNFSRRPWLRLHVFLSQAPGKKVVCLPEILIALQMRWIDCLPEVCVSTSSIPISWNWFWIESDTDAKIFCDAMEKKSCHPQMIAHVYSFTRPNLEFPLQ